jgi:hypothetical protein
MRNAVLVISVALFLFAVGCRRGGGEPTNPEPETGGDAGVAEPTPPPPPPPPEPVKVRARLVHAAATASKAPLSVAYTGEGEAQPLAEGLAYGSTTTYAEATLAPEATKIGLSLAADGFETPDGDVAISDGAAHTVVVYSDAETAGQLHFAASVDESAAPAAGMQARFFHAVVGWGDLDVCTPGATPRDPGTPMFAGVAYGGFATAGYQPLTPETTRLQIREANAETPCSGRVIGGVALRPPQGVDPTTPMNLTFLAVGRGSGRPPVPRGLLVCTDAPADAPACQRVNMTAR